MGRTIATLAILLGLLAGTMSTTFAQSDGATPAAAGAAVPIFGSDGQEEATVEVTSVVDPFEDYDSSSGPDRGFHWVMATVTMTATGDRALEANGFGFVLIDTDGFLYYPGFVFRTQESVDATPDFPGGTLEGGDSMSGAVFFQILDGTAPGLLLYQPSFDRLTTVADLRDEPVAQGDEVAFIASDGAPAGTITVDGVDMPFEGYDSGDSPQRGFEYAAITVTVTNDGNSPLEVDPYDFALVDTEGFVYTSYGLFRSAELEAQQPSLQYNEALAPGESVSGIVTFQVFAGVEPGLIVYAPNSDRHIRVAEYGEGQAPRPSDNLPPPVRPTEESGTDEDETPVATGGPECEGALEWGEATVENVNAWTESLGSIGEAFSGGTPDPDAVRDAADASRDAADTQDGLDVPAIAEDANGKLVELFEETANGLDDLADAIESGDQVAQAEAVDAIVQMVAGEAVEELTPMLEGLADTCPELVILT